MSENADNVTKDVMLENRPTGRQSEPVDTRAPDELPVVDSKAEAENTILSEVEPDETWKAVHNSGKVEPKGAHPGETADGLDGNEEALRAEAEGTLSGGTRTMPTDRISGPVSDRR